MLLEVCSGERERGLNMIRVILVIHSGLFWVLTTNTTLGCGGLDYLLKMQRTGFLQLSLRLALSCLQLAKKEKI